MGSSNRHVNALRQLRTASVLTCLPCMSIAIGLYPETPNIVRSVVISARLNQTIYKTIVRSNPVFVIDFHNGIRRIAEERVQVFSR